MQELKISIDDETLEAYRNYARQHGISLAEAIGLVLRRGAAAAQRDWLEEFFRVMDNAAANSQGRAWRRDELYDV